jgi:NADPH:quinone reductase-like Zn-dependent oxidoreductase
MPGGKEPRISCGGAGAVEHFVGTLTCRRDVSAKSDVGAAATGRIRPRVTEACALDDYRAAFASITGRRARGKVILTINQ